jgi:dTDP-4-dehydrorhamnose 3,5-epimerase
VSWLEIQQTALPGLLAVQRDRREDQRGFFSRLFCAEELAAAAGEFPVHQVNHTLTRRRGSARGLHFQHPPHADGKFVSCLRGEVFDVAVDLRRGSPTFLRWHAEVLSAENARSLLIPAGFAHGFQTLSDDCELLYLHSRPYQAAAEGALNLRDPAVAVRWPLEFADVSERDLRHPLIDAAFIGIDA